MPAPTPTALKIDFVSDVVCPWCAIGLTALTLAAERLQNVVRLQWHIQPFELNPGMGAQGEDLLAHLAAKYGASPAQLAQSHAQIAARGAQLGFVFAPERSRIYNTLDAHRLLHWLEQEGRPKQQLALKRALLKAYFSAGENISDARVLLRLTADLNLDVERARQILLGDTFAAEVRAREAHWQQLGIHSVPAVIVNDRHLIQGGQPVEAFERALRRVASETGAHGA